MTIAELAHGLSADLLAEAVLWRRQLHRNPELAFKEHSTADFIASHLQQAGLSVHRGLAGTGVVATLSRGTSRRVIGIRADMDALPIAEQSGVAHASCSPGVMHACGHDGHVVMALTAAKSCAALANLDGTVHFIFQPAEEGEDGAGRMIREGLFQLFPCDSIYALHNWPALPLGTCIARDGAMMAAMAAFEIVVRGRGCHGAMPHEGTDPLLAACHLVSLMQSIVSRNTDPLQAAVVSATQIRGGDTFNVIPDSCYIRGTTRWFDDEIGEMIERRLRELSNSIAVALGCEAQLSYERRFPATINDPVAAKFVREVARALPAAINVLDAPPSMGAEDFAVMLRAVPGCYFWLGSQRPGHAHGLHSPRYDFNDDLIPLGASLWVSLVRRALSPT